MNDDLSTKEKGFPDDEHENVDIAYYEQWEKKESWEKLR